MNVQERIMWQCGKPTIALKKLNSLPPACPVGRRNPNSSWRLQPLSACGWKNYTFSFHGDFKRNPSLTLLRCNHWSAATPKPKTDTTLGTYMILCLMHFINQLCRWAGERQTSPATHPHTVIPRLAKVHKGGAEREQDSASSSAASSVISHAWFPDWTK
jgi:hypothetical protein